FNLTLFYGFYYWSFDRVHGPGLCAPGVFGADSAAKERSWSRLGFWGLRHRRLVWCGFRQRPHQNHEICGGNLFHDGRVAVGSAKPLTHWKGEWFQKKAGANQGAAGAPTDPGEPADESRRSGCGSADEPEYAEHPGR